MPTSQGKGNRRTGRARATSGRPHGVRWAQDPDVLRRVELVADLYHHPIGQTLEAVNLDLKRRGQEPISYATLKVDRERARELLRERVGIGMEQHLERLQEVIQDAWRSLRRTPEGPARAPLYAVIIRGIEDQAKLDGTWGSLKEPADTPAPEQSNYGPSPQEMLESGEISREDYRAWLLVLHRHTGGHEQGPASHQVVESAALPEPSQPRGPQIKRGSNGRPPSSPPGMPKMGDELPGVVDWKPDGEE